ncbi:MAG TPA: cytochrome c3 family protein [Thermodesulfovibrionales bacterium]|nr:cytochrome c3 family protein [Thermodesulfovibrionales bacterium]
MKRLTVFFLIIFFSILGGVICERAALAQQKMKDADCFASKCHDKMGKQKFVHGPVAVGDCKTCHVPTDKHKFAPIKNVGQLCYKCHEKVDTKKGVHKPVKEGNCTKCHDAHETAYKFQLRADGRNLCFICHDKKVAEGKFVHGPVAVGGCSMCHNPHQTDFPKLLNAMGNEVCFLCHTDSAEAFKGKKFVHKPVADKCIGCHNPHAGDYKFLFVAEGSQELCFKCHEDKKQWMAKIKIKHGGLYTDKKCLACHDPHVSDFVKQLVRQPVESCMICHDKAYKVSDGNIIEMKNFLAQNKVYHGPIKQGDCSGCHNTHGSDYYRILRKNFPPVFYAPFDPKNYDLCFNCHEKTLVLDAKTATLTGFRNGDQNLHFVHVNKEVKGRTCRACHDAHATNNPKHIRDAVPFGAWPLPVGFQKTSNGGSCLPGCHQKFGYDRVSAVKNR